MRKNETFDGVAIEKYLCKFGGRFDADEINSESMSYDDHVCLVIIARVGAAKIGSNHNGDLYRENSLSVLRAVQISADLAEATLKTHEQGASAAPQLTLLQNAPVTNGKVGVDEEEFEDVGGTPLVDSNGERQYATISQLPQSGDDALRRFLEPD